MLFEKEIAIVIVAYNRPKSLDRLLKSIQNTDFGNRQDIPLIISIDNSGKDDCLTIANTFRWENGTKRIINHHTKLGLREHVLRCGDLTKEYDGIILLEDDLLVSPFFFDYAMQAFDFFKNEEKVAGISLYCYSYNEFSDAGFTPIHDGFDNYYAKVPCSLGQLWTKQQWDNFRKFYASADCQISNDDQLPELVLKYWPETSWKKYFFKFMVANNLYFVYPRISLTTNIGETGTHYSSTTDMWQVPILMGRKTFSFSTITQSSSVYDHYLEPEEITIKNFLPELKKYNFECDLNGSKKLSKITKPYLISIREADDYIIGFSKGKIPDILNIILPESGDFYKLGEAKRFNQVIRKKKNEKILSEIKYGHKAMTPGIDWVKESYSYKLGSVLLSPFKKFYRFFNKKAQIKK